MGMLDILNQYAGEPKAQSDTPAHFDQVTSVASPGMLGGGIASMFRSSSTPPFGSSVASLFEQSNATQRAGVLNEIARSLGPSALTAGAECSVGCWAVPRIRRPVRRRQLHPTRHRSCRPRKFPCSQVMPSSRIHRSWTLSARSTPTIRHW